MLGQGKIQILERAEHLLQALHYNFDVNVCKEEEWPLRFFKWRFSPIGVRFFLYGRRRWST
jgi:hypothetical protein